MDSFVQSFVLLLNVKISLKVTYMALNQNELLPCEFLDLTRNKRLCYNNYIEMFTL